MSYRDFETRQRRQYSRKLAVESAVVSILSLGIALQAFIVVDATFGLLAAHFLGRVSQWYLDGKREASK